MDYSDYIEQQESKSKAMSESQILEVKEFHKMCQTKLNYSARENVINQVLSLKELYKNLDIFFDNLSSDNVFKFGYCDED